MRETNTGTTEVSSISFCRLKWHDFSAGTNNYIKCKEKNRETATDSVRFLTLVSCGSLALLLNLQ